MTRLPSRETPPENPASAQVLEPYIVAAQYCSEYDRATTSWSVLVEKLAQTQPSSVKIEDDRKAYVRWTFARDDELMAAMREGTPHDLASVNIQGSIQKTDEAYRGVRAVIQEVFNPQPYSRWRRPPAMLGVEAIRGEGLRYSYPDTELLSAIGRTVATCMTRVVYTDKINDITRLASDVNSIESFAKVYNSQGHHPEYEQNKSTMLNLLRHNIEVIQSNGGKIDEIIDRLSDKAMQPVLAQRDEASGMLDVSQWPKDA